MEKSIFKIIATYQYTSEAIIFKGKLGSEGIEVFMRDNNTVDTNPLYSNAVGGVKLFVKSEDFYIANTILSQVSKYSLDENNEFIDCPKCGGKEINMVTSITDFKSFLSFLFSLLLIILPFYSKHKYKCNKRKFEFN